MSVTTTTQTQGQEFPTIAAAMCFAANHPQFRDAITLTTTVRSVFGDVIASRTETLSHAFQCEWVDDMVLWGRIERVARGPLETGWYVHSAAGPQSVGVHFVESFGAALAIAAATFPS